MFVITRCGKKIQFNDSSVKQLSWSILSVNKKNIDFLNKSHLDTSKFTKDTPKIIDFEVALEEQVPVQILENKSTNFFVLQNINYNGSNLTVTGDDIQLFVPKNSWTSFPADFTHNAAIVSLFHTLNKQQDANNSRNYFGSIFIVGFFKHWMCIYKISYFQGNLIIQSVLFKNSNFYINDIVEETYGEYKIKKEQKYFMITGKKSVSLNGYLKIKYGWIDSGFLRDISFNSTR